MSDMPLVDVKDSIATHLLKVVFSFYIFLTIAVTLAHMFAEFYSTRGEVEHELQVIGQTFEPGLAQALWDYNLEQLKPTFLGMVTFPTVEGIKLINEKGKIVGATGRIINAQDQPIQYVNEYDQQLVVGYTGLFEHQFNIVFKRKDEDVIVGVATIYSSDRVVFEKVKLGFIFVIVNAMIKTVALWVLFLVISRRLLSRPLAMLTAATQQIDLDKLGEFKVSIVTK
ncbi:MAG: hypothetical protein MJK04_29480, partial [Psychrosphaera sp.]|nr:hypothetical protein [Psychrosphaera sp.]